jgi:hypothetical protein
MRIDAAFQFNACGNRNVRSFVKLVETRYDCLIALAQMHNDIGIEQKNQSSVKSGAVWKFDGFARFRIFYRT